MADPDESTEQAKPRRNTGRIIISGSAGRVALTPSHQVDEIPFIPAFDLLEECADTELSGPEVALIAATLWSETAPEHESGGSRWLQAARNLSISQRL